MERSDNEIEFARLLTALFAVGAVIPGGLSEAAYELKMPFEEVNRIFNNAIDISLDDRQRREGTSPPIDDNPEWLPGS